MEYTEEQQRYLDIEWFAVDQNGLIISFTSCGGKLPSSVALNKAENQIIVDYFDKLLEKNTNVLISSKLGELFNSSEQLEKYVNASISKSKKGLFSFDKSLLNNFGDTNYHLVTYPEKYLKLEELPVEIQNILFKTKINKDMEGVYSFDILEIM